MTPSIWPAELDVKAERYYIRIITKIGNEPLLFQELVTKLSVIKSMICYNRIW